MIWHSVTRSTYTGATMAAMAYDMFFLIGGIAFLAWDVVRHVH